MNSNEAFGMLIRYLLLLIMPLGNLFLFYFIFTPATIYPVYWILHKLVGAQLLVGNVIFIKGYYAEVISACIAGAAYYFLFILNLSTPMKIEKRIKSLFFMFLTFLILNIIRIVIFAELFSVGYKYFDLTHALVWYFGSTVLVVLVWFTNVFIFNIHAIPIYTDFAELIRSIITKNKK